MPPPLPVRLVPHNPQWADLARQEGVRIQDATGPVVIDVHHVGSTAVPGIAAKPTLDLLLVAASLAEFDGLRPVLEKLGYAWHGEYGLTGRRYCTLTCTETDERRVNLHAYAEGDPSIARHLAFRDHLRARPDVAAAYDREKARCAALHPNDSHAYTDCKAAWIRAVEAKALREA